jgi:uncharacterized protein YceH (UPF0502 family)
MELTAEEGRVLGCLVEKQLTTPQAYPLTDNALIAACNQTTSREPVVDYDIGTVRMAVRGLRDQGLLRTVHRTGERSDKHQHELGTSLGLATPAQVLLAVLLLRGPQTAAELRMRSERMHPFASFDEVAAVAGELAARGLAVRLERQPGRKEDRFAQVLCSSELQIASHGPPPTALPPAWAPLPSSGASAPPSVSGAPEGPTLAGLAQEVEALRADMEALRAQIGSLLTERPEHDLPTVDPRQG